ncbi:hypothetical protein ABIF86_007170 [Bradyrhizobium japonicum]
MDINVILNFISNAMDWSAVLRTIVSTGVVVAILSFLARTTITHYLKRNVETHKANLTRDVETQKTELSREVETHKAGLSREVESHKARLALDGETHKAWLSQQAQEALAAFKAELDTKTARFDRIRQEILLWSNPILGSVRELQNRLDNIIADEGYLLLSPNSKAEINPEWSIDYEYFFPSTVFLFAQYFCWVRLLEERLSFELFEEQVEKDQFFQKVNEVGRTLSEFPLRETEEISHPGDIQVFRLQQRALGETLYVGDGTNLRAMRYSEFLEKWNDAKFKRRFDPLAHFLNKLEPKEKSRWKRLVLMREALQELQSTCEHLLSSKNA